MDTSSLLAQIKARFQHNSSKAYIKAKYQAKLVIAYNGGMWKITPELLSFLWSTPELTVISDMYDNPIQVNSKELFNKAKTVYDNVMNEWYIEYKELENNR